MKRFVYRRVRETCADCHEPIDREPQHGGNLYGWEPRLGVCFSCFTIDLFGCNSDPSPEWWRKIRRLLRAADAAMTENMQTFLPDSEEPEF